MFTVSLIGPDGVGKTTVAKKMIDYLPVPAKYIYMGLNSAAANISLPTSMLKKQIQARKSGKKKFSEITPKVRKNTIAGFRNIILFRQILRLVKKTLGLVNLILEEWYRQLIACVYEKLGYIVIFDRHFIYDFHDFDDNCEAKSFTRKIHDFIRDRTMFSPDLVICLDVPGDVAFKRKGEFSIEDLEIKRRNYLNLQKMVNNFVVINADRNLDLVLKDVGDCITEFYKSRK